MLLSDTQKMILASVCKAKQNSVGIPQLVADLGPSVEDEIKPMIQADLLYLSHPRAHGKRPLRLTDKGEAFAFAYCGVDFDLLVANHPYLDSADGIKEYKSIIKDPDGRTAIIYKFASLMIDKHLFGAEGRSSFDSVGNKWTRRDILIALTNDLIILNAEKPGTVNFKKWLSYVKKIDSSVKLEGLVKSNSPPPATAGAGI